MHSFKEYIFFTKQEKIFIILLIVTFLIGFGVNLYGHLWGNSESYLINENELENIEKEILAIIIDEDTIKQDFLSKSSQKEKLLTLCIDINSATKEEFELLPYIGPVISQRIIIYREKIGRFKTVDELVNVKGIGTKTLDKLRPFIKIVN